MNIVEAKKSGKLIRRPHHENEFTFTPKWLMIEEFDGFEMMICAYEENPCDEDGGNLFDLYMDDFLADDWMVKED